MLHLIAKWPTSFTFLSGASIDNFIHAVKSQNILVETATFINVSDQLIHNGAIKVAREKEVNLMLIFF